MRDHPIIYDPSSGFQNQVRKFDFDNFQSNLGNDRVEIEDIVDSDNLKKSKSELYGDSVYLSQLESWVDQYKADSEFWGVGSGRIFTVFQNSNGKVERVDVNEDEIWRRRGLDPAFYKESEPEELAEVNSKISHAKYLAREIENGNNLLSKNCSVANFVVLGGESNFVNEIRGVSLPPGLFSRLSKVGIVVLCGFFVFWAMKRLFVADEDKTEYTRLEKEMLRRKMKARTVKEKLVKGSMEVIQAPKELELKTTKRPCLDKQDLVNSILKAKGSNDSLALQRSSGIKDVNSTDFENKIQEIRAMARHARELEKNDLGGPGGSGGGEDNQVGNKLFNGKEAIQQDGERSLSSPNDNEYLGRVEGVGETINSTSCDDLKSNGTGISEVSLVESSDTENSISEINISNDGESRTHDLKEKDAGLYLLDTTEGSQLSDATGTPFTEPKIISVKPKPRIIRYVKEAREYLSQKRDRQEQNEESLIRTVKEDRISGENVTDGETSQRLDGNNKLVDVFISSGTQDFMHASHASPDYTLKRNESTPVKFIDPEAAEEVYEAIDHQIPGASLSYECSDSNAERGPSILSFPNNEESERQRNQKSEMNDEGLQTSSVDAKSYSTSTITTSGVSKAKGTIPTMNNVAKDIEEGINHQMPVSSLDPASSGRTAEAAPSVQKENWMEKNFHEFEPVAKKIAVGFKDNYMVAREKVNQRLNLDSEMKLPKSDEDEGELDWMKDDRLREIVFQVRENELMGRDPFHLMDAEDKQAFFDGLEKKVEKETEKLQNLHQWVHSNIENLDYGADGISLNDPPEKVIPRWKGPPVDSTPEFLDDYLEQRKALVTEKLRNQFIENRDEESSLQKSVDCSLGENGVTTAAISTQNKKHQDGNVKTPKIVIEGSDGSVRAGKKSGKEYWEHTKKWSRGFLESYNAEADPEIKATMKDIGKDLDRWITEKEIQESADLMDKLPERGRRIIQEKLNKVKREMESFGPQAVVSKYSEYAEEKEEDYLWWLDLPFVLCIELYTNQDGDQSIGFYSLEMAADLELNPKQYHVIAFEDAGDCKNLCYIIQSHMEMLGNGNAFVVAQPPKDAFREAKANGFSVTVIRKGELKLNVDQTLEEVEEQITEIGSKIYHDKIMKGRSVDISSLMKGVFGVTKPMKRKRSKRRKLKKPTKN